MPRIVLNIILGVFFLTSANAAEFTLKSNSFKNNSRIPVLYSCDGKNLSPELHWENTPANAKSYVLVFSSPDSPAGEVYFWILYDIPADIHQLAEGANNDIPDGIEIGNNWYNESDYRGPCPPDSLAHHYAFTLYALDINKLDLLSDAEIEEVFAKMHKHIIKQTELTGIFSH